MPEQVLHGHLAFRRDGRVGDARELRVGARHADPLALERGQEFRYRVGQLDFAFGRPNALRGETKIFYGQPMPSFLSRKFCRWPQPCLEPHCVFFVSTLSG
jgi:hypothetical protein